MFMADSPEFVVGLPGRDADRRGAGAGLDHVPRRRPGRAAARLPGPAARGQPGVRRRSPRSPRRPRRSCAAILAAGPVPSPLPVHAAGRRSAGGGGTTTVYPTDADSPAFWLYTSGTTGTPKAAMHRHGSIAGGLRDVRRAGAAASARTTAACRRPRRSSRTGWATRLLFPLSVGRGRGARAGAVPAGRARRAGRRSTARRCSSPVRRSSPTCCARELPADALAGVRLAASRRRGAAGRALPAVDRPLRRRHPRRHRHDRDAAHLPVQPARRGPARHHRRRRARLRPADPRRRRPRGRRRARPGTLFVRGDSTATGYWSRYDGLPPGLPGRVAAHRRHLRARTPTATTPASAAPATCSRPAASGSSPAEVEERLLAHDAVAQAVVVAAPDADGLEKPVAYVVLRDGRARRPRTS